MIQDVYKRQEKPPTGEFATTPYDDYDELRNALIDLSLIHISPSDKAVTQLTPLYYFFFFVIFTLIL